MEVDNRKERRFAVKVSFSARDESGAGTLSFTSADVSSGGAFLQSELLLEEGEALILDFEVPDAGPIQAKAKVAWVRRFPKAEEVAGMGVAFVALRSEDREAIAAWLAR